MGKMIRNKVENLLDALSSGALEREEAISLAFLSAAAGESIFLLGLPGVAKSMIARRLALAFKDARRFEYLMSRFSTPDEIFGPVSISKLKDSDTYERVVDGYLPTADVAFLDEIWKAGPAIQNSLLTALNEKIFRNGRDNIKLPLKGIIAASNELPAQGEGLEALWDRFLIRYIVDPIKDKGNFLSLLNGKTEISCHVPDSLKFSAEEISTLQIARDEIEVPEEVLEFLFTMRSKYAQRAKENLKDKVAAAKAGAQEDDDEEEDNVPYVSDRRWKKIVGILRSSALLNGRSKVDWSDCLLLEHLIWDNDSQLVMVRDDIAKELVLALLKDVASATDNSRWKKAPEEMKEKKFWSPDGGKHYAFEAGGELLQIATDDYAKLSATKMNGRFGESGLIQLCEGAGEFSIRCTKPGTVTIGNFTYPLRLEGTASGKSGAFLSGIMMNTADRISSFKTMMDDNLFTRPLVTYKTLGLELRRYQSKIDSVSYRR